MILFSFGAFFAFLTLLSCIAFEFNLLPSWGVELIIIEAILSAIFLIVSSPLCSDSSCKLMAQNKRRE